MEARQHPPNETEEPQARPIVKLLLVMLLIVIAGWVIAQLALHP